MLIKSSVSLKTVSQIKVGGTAQEVYYPQSLAEFVECLKSHPQALIIGGGSNVFFDDKTYPEIIITTKLVEVQKNSDGTFWADCGLRAAKLFSFAAGVPATIGGALCMNFGAFDKEIQEFVLGVEVYDKKAEKIIYLTKEQIGFVYRNSGLRNPDLVVLRGLFSGRYLENAKEWLAKRKSNMPWDYPNIGSFFRNPTKGSAGYYIEHSGLKGYQVGDAEVSQHHANIIINRKNATAKDLLILITHIQKIVKSRFKVNLELEVEFKA